MSGDKVLNEEQPTCEIIKFEEGLFLFNGKPPKKEKTSVLSTYLWYLNRQIKFEELAENTIRRKKSELKQIGFLLDVPFDEIIDTYSSTIESILGRLTHLTQTWMKEGKTARTIKSRHDELIHAICTVLNTFNISPSSHKSSLQRRFSRLRKKYGPAKEKPWSPTNEDIRNLFEYLDNAIEGRVEAPGARYHAKTKTWSRKMSKKVLVRLRAALVIQASLAGRTAEIVDIKRNDIENMNVKRVLRKGREPIVLEGKIHPNLWPYVQAWLELLPKDEDRLFPAGTSVLSDQVSALMRQAGWKGKENGLYAFRRWGLSALQEKGVHDHAIMSVSGHKSKDSMRTYLAPTTEQRMAQETLNTLQQHVLDTIGVNSIHEIPELISSALNELNRAIQSYTASEVKAIIKIKEERDQHESQYDDFLVERIDEGQHSEKFYSLEHENFVEHTNESIPFLKNGGDRFQVRMGGKLRNIKAIGPSIKNEGGQSEPENLTFINNESDLDNMASVTENNERTRQDSNPRSVA